MGDKNAELPLLVARKLEDDPGGGAVKVNRQPEPTEEQRRRGLEIARRHGAA
jgi:hypothetical protein